MKEYICTVCGYVHKGEMPDDFRCPVCGAGKEAFILSETSPRGKAVLVRKKATKTPSSAAEPATERALSAMELSIICSNLARGCEKQYMTEEMQKFTNLSQFFRSQAGEAAGADFGEILKLVQRDLESGYPSAHAIADGAKDRGAKRALVWSEKVTTMLSSLLARYEKEGEAMLKDTGVFVCTICGFVYVGDNPPDICPVCKVPSWKFEKVSGRE